MAERSPRAPDDEQAEGGFEAWQEWSSCCFQMRARLKTSHGIQKRWLMVRIYDNGEATLCELLKPIK